MLVLDDEPRLFEFELHGKVYAVTSLDAIPLAKTDALKGVKTDAEAVEWIRSEIFDKECPEAMRDMTVGHWKKLVRAYLDESEATLGESPA